MKIDNQDANELPSYAELHRLFSYRDGALIRKVSTTNAVHVGDRAGTERPEGYRRVHVNDRTYAESRIIWYMCTGKEPMGVIDHINGIVNDNRIENLRDITQRTNQLLTHGVPKDNTSGARGVYWDGTAKWMAMAFRSRKRIYLGRYDTVEEAVQARKEWEYENRVIC